MPVSFGELGEPRRVSLLATVQSLQLPSGTKYVRVLPIGTDAFLTLGVADGDPTGTNFETYTAGIPAVRHAGASRSGYGISGTALAICEITPLPAGD